MCKISIIVPVYNAEKYLENCIESIIDQTFNDFELILIDDGSVDRSREICDKYRKIDKRIKTIYKENGGASSARNRGLDIAKGEYIAFVDSDDYIHNRMYEILYNTAINNSSDIVICDYLEVYEFEEDIILNNRKKNIKLNQNEVINYNNIEALREIYTDEGVKLIIPCNKLFKRYLFNDLRYIEGRICEDEFMAHEILYLSKIVSYIPINLYYYLQTSNSVMRTDTKINIIDGVDALKERVYYFKAKNLKDLRYKAEISYVVRCINTYYKLKNSLVNCDKELTRIKKDFIFLLPYIIKNPFYNFKETIALIIFGINSNIYYNKFMNRKKGGQ